MKISILTITVLFLIVVSAVHASDMARSHAAATPQIVVKKKSTFLPADDSFWFHMKSALNTLTGETLVVWKEDIFVSEGAYLGTQVTGRIISPKGNQTTKKIAIPPDGRLGHGVTHNPVRNEFLVVYTRNGSISGQRFDSNAKAIGKEFEIVPATLENSNFRPFVIFNPVTNGYAVTWEREEGIAAALLDQSGRITGPFVIIKKNPDSNGYYDNWGGQILAGSPRVLGFAFLPSGNKLLIVFQQRFSETNGDYWLATLDPTLKNISPSNLARINQKTVDFTPEPSWIVSRSGWGASLATLQDGSSLVYFGDKTSVKCRKIDLNGKLSSIAFPAFSGRLKNAHLIDPEVAFSTISTGTTGLLIATQSDYQNRGIAWAQALNSKGRPIGIPLAVNAVERPDYHMGSELIALPRTASDKLLQYVYFQNQGRGSGEAHTLRLDLDVQP